MTKFSSIFLRYFILVTAISVLQKINQHTQISFQQWPGRGASPSLARAKSHFLQSPFAG